MKMTTEDREIKSAQWRKDHLGKNAVLSGVRKRFEGWGDNDYKMLKRALKNLEKKGVTLELVDDMILLIDSNAPEGDQVFDKLGGCG